MKAVSLWVSRLISVINANVKKGVQSIMDKEQYRGKWNGKDVHFGRDWRGYHLSDAECEALCAGKEIEIRGLVSRKTGKTYGVLARLEDLVSSSGRAYVGLNQVSYLKRGVPQEFCRHKFTEDERTLLEAGKTVQIDDFVSGKTGKTFGCKVTYDEAEDRLQLHFD